MARIRSIKPTFWTDEKVGLLPPLARLTFLGLISALADDEGRLRGNARIVRAAIYPYDDTPTAADVEQHLALLEQAGRIVRYTVAGDDLIEITNWRRHQRIDRPSASLLPPPPAGSDEQRGQGSRTDSSNTPGRFVEHSTTVLDGEEGSGVEGNGHQPAAASPAREAAAAVLLAAFPVLADALPPEAGHDPLLELARAMPDTRAYLGACLGALEGMHGYVLSPAELRTAITDWLANREHPNLRRFRGYLKGARARADDSLGASRRVPTRRPAPQTYDYAPTNSEEDVKWQS